MTVVELDAPAQRPGPEYERAWVVGCRSGIPVGIAEVDHLHEPGRWEDALAGLASGWTGLGRTPVADADLPRISVVVPTIVQRVDDLARGLTSLTTLDYPDYEVVLVDNRTSVPSPDPLPALLQGFPRVRLVVERHPGISAARNRGVAAADGALVVFTDDDVRVQPEWLRAIGSRFVTEPALTAVTGLILPAELETPAQLHFERFYGGFSGVRTFEPLTLRAGPTRAQVEVVTSDGTVRQTFAVYGIGAFGAGANMAFRTDWLRAGHGFDLALGAGTRARGGEDLAALVDVLWSGGRLGYEPSAVVLHRHRRDDDELRHQLEGNGVGFTAMLSSVVLGDRRHLGSLGSQLPRAGVRMATQAVERLRSRRPTTRSAAAVGSALGGAAGGAEGGFDDYPRALVLHEIGGMWRGPLAYARSRRSLHRAPTRPDRSSVAPGDPSDTREPGPVHLLTVDLDGDRPVLPAGDVDHWVVARQAGFPVAMLEVDAGTDPDAYAAQLDALAAAHPPVARPWLDVADADLPRASVVVPSLVRRVADLERCLDSLAALDYPDYEVVVVDNRRDLPEHDPLTAMLAGRPHFRTVRTGRPGVAGARNAGLRAATGEVVAFTDDDVQVDPRWLRAFGARFAAEPGLGGCTGLILPAELETPAQVWFERYFGGFAGERLFAPLVLRTGTGLLGRGALTATGEDGTVVRRSPLYGVGAYGAGANMALRRWTALSVGGFDDALGTGTPTTGGEDLRVFMDVLWAGYPMRYEPAAVVRHRHRRGYDELTRQIRAGGTGMTATLTALVVDDPRHLVGLGVQLPVAVRRLAASTLRRLRGRGTAAPEPAEEPVELFPRELVRLELGGMPAGPLAYGRSRLEQRRWSHAHPDED